jgi:hypothetical protein
MEATFGKKTRLRKRDAHTLARIIWIHNCLSISVGEKGRASWFRDGEQQQSAKRFKGHLGCVSYDRVTHEVWVIERIAFISMIV